MTKMKLYYSPISPYARKVRVVAMETRLDHNMEMVNVSVSPVVPNADVVKHNPIGKIPALSVKGTKKIEGVLAQLEAEANSLKGKPTALAKRHSLQLVPSPFEHTF
jgi:hypothetical protein